MKKKFYFFLVLWASAYDSNVSVFDNWGSTFDSKTSVIGSKVSVFDIEASVFDNWVSAFDSETSVVVFKMARRLCGFADFADCWSEDRETVSGE